MVTCALRPGRSAGGTSSSLKVTSNCRVGPWTWPKNRPVWLMPPTSDVRALIGAPPSASMADHRRLALRRAARARSRGPWRENSMLREVEHLRDQASARDGVALAIFVERHPPEEEVGLAVLAHRDDAVHRRAQLHLIEQPLRLIDGDLRLVPLLEPRPPSPPGSTSRATVTSSSSCASRRLASSSVSSRLRASIALSSSLPCTSSSAFRTSNRAVSRSTSSCAFCAAFSASSFVDLELGFEQDDSLLLDLVLLVRGIELDHEIALLHLGAGRPEREEAELGPRGGRRERAPSCVALELAHGVNARVHLAALDRGRGHAGAVRLQLRERGPRAGDDARRAGRVQLRRKRSVSWDRPMIEWRVTNPTDESRLRLDEPADHQPRLSTSVVVVRHGMSGPARLPGSRAPRARLPAGLPMATWSALRRATTTGRSSKPRRVVT